MDLRTWREAKFDVAGEQVTMEIKPLLNEHLLILSPHIRKAGDKERTPEQTNQDAMEALPVFREVFAESVRDVSITIDGEECPPTMIAEDVRLQELAWMVVVELVKISSLDKVDEGNSGGESPAPEA